MAEKKYLDYKGLVQLSGEIKNRVKSVNSLPVSAPAGATYLYVGEDTQNYKKGHTYQYQTNSWTDITPPTSTFNDEDFSVDAQNEVSLLPARRVYRGTRAAWDLLSVAEKTQYGATAFTDDEDLPSNMVLLTEITPIDTQWHFSLNPIDISQFSYIYAEGLDANGARTGGNIIIPRSLFEHCTPSNPFLLMRGGLALSNCCLICQTAADYIGLYTGAAVYADGTVIVKAKFYGIK